MGVDDLQLARPHVDVGALGARDGRARAVGQGGHVAVLHADHVALGEGEVRLEADEGPQGLRPRRVLRLGGQPAVEQVL